MTINMTQLTGPRLKKALNLDRANKRYHNKNKSGGNFGINLKKGDSWFEINGRHNTKGDVTYATVSELYHPGLTVIQPNNYQFTEWPEFTHTISSYITTELHIGY